MRSRYWAVALAAMAAFAAPGAWAQEAASLAVAPAVAIDPATVEIPDLGFVETPEHIENYDKYFYFVRADTDFATAYADVRECDDYARGLRFFNMGVDVPYPYAGTLAGALGGILGSVLSDAISGSAQRRQLRRTNLRTCMGYKGYGRFGLPKAIWVKFNFSEGNSPPSEADRETCLRQQAKIASGAMPQRRALGR